MSSRIYFLLGIIILCFVQLPYAQALLPKSFKLPSELQEVSGLAYQSADSLLWLNDSGHGPYIYLTNGEGELQSSYAIAPATNRDWEDMTVDDAGRIFVGDFGNNRRLPVDLKIYCFEENGTALDSITFEYPNGQQYDAEAFFWHNDSLHLFTKSRIARGHLSTLHFVLPASSGHYEAELRDSIQLKKRVVTSAAIDAETGDVVLLAYYYRKFLGIFPRSAASVFFFKNYPEGHFLQGEICKKSISFLIATQYESVDFINEKYILVASEKTVFIPPKAKRVRRRH